MMSGLFWCESTLVCLCVGLVDHPWLGEVKFDVSVAMVTIALGLQFDGNISVG